MDVSSKTAVLIACVMTVVFNVMTYILTRNWIILIAAGFLAWFSYLCFDLSREAWRRKFFLFLSVSTAVYSGLMFLLSTMSSESSGLLIYYGACLAAYVIFNALSALYFKRMSPSR